MGMVGRKYQLGSSTYKYSINGQEKSDELNENLTTAKFWEYDSRIGRRWNIDPKYNVSESPYCVFGNNPNYYLDVNGDKIKNGDQMVLEKEKKHLGEIQQYKEGLMKKYNIREGMKKKEFLKSGGTKEQWGEYDAELQVEKTSKNQIKGMEKRANITQKLIDNWGANAPNIYKEVDGKSVDFILMSNNTSLTDNEEETTAGGTGSNFLGTISNPTLYAVLPNGDMVKNAVGITISQYISFTKANRTIVYTKSDGTTTAKQFLLNHEAGHFLYLVDFTTAYLQYKDLIIKSGKDLQGGHNSGNKSGEKAADYGSVKDIKN